MCKSVVPSCISVWEKFCKWEMQSVDLQMGGSVTTSYMIAHINANCIHPSKVKCLTKYVFCYALSVLLSMYHVMIKAINI